MQIRAQEIPLNATAEALHQLFASEWDYQMEQYPTVGFNARGPALERPVAGPKPCCH